MDRERARVQEGLNRMRRCLDAWFEIQQLYMPGVAGLCTNWNKEQLAAKARLKLAAAKAAAEVQNDDMEPQRKKKGRKPRKHHAHTKPIEEALKAVDIPLFLPSSTINLIRNNKKLLNFEFRLCEAEAYECLTTLH